MKLLPGSITHDDAWKAFGQKMIGRQYGREETRDAWFWFLSGWLKSGQHMNFNSERESK